MNWGKHFVHIYTHICMRVALKITPPYFNMLAYDIRGGRCWWYSSRGWTFPPVFHYISLPCDRWQQSGTLTQRHLTEVRRKHRCVNELLHAEKNGTHWHSPAPAECQWRPNSGCEHREAAAVCLSSGDKDVKNKPRSGWPCRLLVVWHAGFCLSLVKMHS